MTAPSPLPAHQHSTLGIDEELWFGAPDFAATEAAAATSMAALAGRVVGAKPFPESAQRVSRIVSTEGYQVDEVIEVLERDPALSARLLRLVNSAGFGLRQACSSVRHAVTLVGGARLQQIATTAAVLELFESESDLASEILDHSAVVGAFSRYLGAHFGLPREDLFTAGFLHDIGKLMLLESEGSGYEDFFRECSQEADRLHTVERSHYGFDHGVLAAHVLRAWSIPDPVPQVVSWHHEPLQAYAAPARMAQLVHTVRLADALSYLVAADARDGLEQLAKQEAASYLEISAAQLAGMWRELTVLRAHSLDQEAPPEGTTSTPSEGAEKEPSPGAQPTPSSRPVAEEAENPIASVPRQFPCVVCHQPSFGSTCPACGGHACPDHHEGRDQWCSLCAGEYLEFNQQTRLPRLAFVGILAALASIATLLAVGMIVVEGDAEVRLAIGGALLFALAGALVAVGRRAYVRARFLRSRPERGRQ